ncbi:MAG: asparaginase [Ornithinimicrobium sp.]|uniref:asparaginase n=1 Tax=Ornithinimicrobium sp. TaxID=1977084 RepID=UPI003D9B6F08
MPQTIHTTVPAPPDADGLVDRLGSAPVVAALTRSGLVESVHHGIVVATDADGAPVLERGDVTTPIYPRSSNKPIQAVAMLRSGLDLDGELLALAGASHNGEGFHLEGARRILAGAGLSEVALQNTPDLPSHEPERDRWVAAGRTPASIAQNCSGKHAAMLATCVTAGWDTATYRDPGHPLQQVIAETLAELSGEPIAAIGVDGCGAPAMAISPLGLARALGRIAAADPGSPQGRVAAAFRGYPQWLGGTDRGVTALIRGVPGLVAKDGAESVYAVGLADGRGLAVKITDGNQRARAVVTVAALRALGVGASDEAVAQALESVAESPVLGHGRPVGAVTAVGI